MTKVWDPCLAAILDGRDGDCIIDSNLCMRREIWLPDTRLLRRPKADEVRLMRLWISFERSPENEILEI